MKTHRKVGRRLFLISLVAFLSSACSVWLVPFIKDRDDGTISLISIIIGIIFWIGLLVGIIFFIITWIKVKNDGDYQMLKKKKKPGYISFFTNRFAMIADGLLIISCVVTIVGSYFIRMPAGILIPVLFLALYSLYLHFLLNGRVYSYISIKKKKEKKNEKQN